MIQQAIYDFLSDQSGMIDEIFWLDNAESYPCISFKCISDPKQYQSEDRWQRWRFFVIGPDAWEVESITKELISNLDMLHGDMAGQNIDHIEKMDTSSIERRSDNNYEQYTDFRICYH